MKLVTDATGNNLTYRIIGTAMNVHNALGPGHKEDIYHRAMWTELRTQEIPVEFEVPVEVYYASERVGLYYLDLFVDGLVVVEVKAFSHLMTDTELAQMLNYLKATQAPVGLLFNFGRRRLDFQRVFPGKVGSHNEWGRRSELT